MSCLGQTTSVAQNRPAAHTTNPTVATTSAQEALRMRSEICRSSLTRRSLRTLLRETIRSTAGHLRTMLATRPGDPDFTPSAFTNFQVPVEGLKEPAPSPAGDNEKIPVQGLIMLAFSETHSRKFASLSLSTRSLYRGFSTVLSTGRVARCLGEDHS